MLEQSDGQLMVQHEGKVIAHQEAPPKAGALRAAQGALDLLPKSSYWMRSVYQVRHLGAKARCLFCCLNRQVNPRPENQCGTGATTWASTTQDEARIRHNPVERPANIAE